MTPKSKEELKDELTFIVYGNRINKYKTLVGSERKPIDSLLHLFTTYHQQQLEQAVREAELRIARYAVGTIEGNSYNDTIKLLQIVIDSRIAELQSTVKEDKSNE